MNSNLFFETFLKNIRIFWNSNTYFGGLKANSGGRMTNSGGNIDFFW